MIDINNFKSILSEYKNINLINVWRYMTTWSFVLVLLHKWTFMYVNLLLLSGCVLVFAMYISYIQPGYIKYSDGKEYKITGKAKYAMDVMFHVSPFVFILYKYGRYYTNKAVAWSLPTSNAFLIILLYMIMFDPTQTYDVTFAVVYVLAALLVVYLLLTKKHM